MLDKATRSGVEQVPVEWVVNEANEANQPGGPIAITGFPPSAELCC